MPRPLGNVAKLVAALAWKAGWVNSPWRFKSSRFRHVHERAGKPHQCRIVYHQEDMRMVSAMPRKHPRVNSPCRFESGVFRIGVNGRYYQFDSGLGAGAQAVRVRITKYWGQIG
jgi:hypothetical protein